MSEESRKWWQLVDALMDRYCSIVEDGLIERWDKFNVKVSDSETYEVIGGLLARQATLTIYLAQAPQIWNGHIAPLILRCMTDVHINLAWIIDSPKERAKKYILYGLGQEKLHTEHLRNEYNMERPKDSKLEKLIQAKESWLNS